MKKKTLLLSWCLCTLIALSVRSQDLIIPQTGFSISTVDSVAIERGSSKKLNVWILRSKSFANRKIKVKTTSILPEGVDVSFPNQKDYLNNMCEVTVSVDPKAAAGTYYIILSGSVGYLNKGRAIKLKVSEPESPNIGG